MSGKVIAFFPEAAFGPALNSVGIAQACEKLGHKAVFLTDPGMQGVYSGYGFDEYTVNMSEPMPPEEMAKYWTEFINGHIPNFDLTAYEQIDNYVKECWEAIVETAQKLPYPDCWLFIASLPCARPFFCRLGAWSDTHKRLIKSWMMDMRSVTTTTFMNTPIR